MILTIKAVSEELKEDGNPKHIEWTVVDAAGKEIKIKLYPSIKLGDEWLHFEDRWDEFRNAHNKSYDIERANIKVEKGYWKPVIKATEVKNLFVKEAQKQITDSRGESIQAQVAFKGFIELACADKLKMNDPIILATLAWGIQKLGGKDETISSKDTQSSQEIPTTEAGQFLGGETGTSDKGGGDTPENAQDLMKWAVSHGKQYHSSWVRKQASLGDAVITNEVAVRVYEELKALMDWD